MGESSGIVSVEGITQIRTGGIAVIIKDERGISLPLVMIVMIVLSLLGAALMQYSTTDTIQVAGDVKRMQAHYLARSGADATAAWMVVPANNGDTLINKQTSSTASLGVGTVGTISKVKVYPDPQNSNIIIIESIGSVDDVQETVYLTLTVTISDEGLSIYNREFWKST